MKIFRIVTIIMFLQAFMSCGLIFEEDLSKKKIQLISPADSSRNKLTTQLFLWEQDEEIEAFRIQIATPDFSGSIVEDTLTSQTSFEVNLPAREYQWRVRGENSVNNLTPYTTRNLRVDTLKDIREITVQLSTPQASYTYDEGDQIKLTWEPVRFADKYIVTVLSLDESKPIENGVKESFGTELILNNGVIPEFTETEKRNEEVFQFTWQVRAFISNDNQSKSSEVRSFGVKAINDIQP